MNEEIFFPDNQFIISKTDIKGKIKYANELFVNMSGYCNKELIGKPHSILRHPEMPKLIFKKLWSELLLGNEVFAYVKNKTKHEKYYWVLAFVTPSYDNKGNLTEYFSVRRKPEGNVIKDYIDPLYQELLSLEKKIGVNASQDYLNSLLEQKGLSYEQFIFSL
ncbi:MAG: PAS domain S-box-containing protein [Sulfurimonas sp.]|jgi:PAS domain S-box-containing protein